MCGANIFHYKSSKMENNEINAGSMNLFVSINFFADSLPVIPPADSAFLYALK